MMFNVIFSFLLLCFSSEKTYASSPEYIHINRYVFPDYLELNPIVLLPEESQVSDESLKLIDFSQTLMRKISRKDEPILLLIAVDSIMRSFVLGNNSAIYLLESSLFLNPIISSIISNFFGLCFAFGIKFQKNLAKALKCFQHAEQLGNDQSSINLLIICSNNNFIDYGIKNLVRIIEQIKRGDREALYWTIKFAPELVAVKKESKHLLMDVTSFSSMIHKVSGTYYEICAYNYEPGIVNLFSADRYANMLKEANNHYQGMDLTLHPWIQSCFRIYYERSHCLHPEQISKINREYLLRNQKKIIRSKL
jgi:hypothetical protein